MLTRDDCDGGVKPEITTASGNRAVGSQGEEEISAAVGLQDLLICDNAAMTDAGKCTVEGPEPVLNFLHSSSSLLCTLVGRVTKHCAPCSAEETILIGHQTGGSSLV